MSAVAARKKRRLDDHRLISLPNELLIGIFALLDVADLFRLHSLSSYFDTFLLRHASCFRQKTGIEVYIDMPNDEETRYLRFSQKPLKGYISTMNFNNADAFKPWKCGNQMCQKQQFSILSGGSMAVFRTPKDTQTWNEVLPVLVILFRRIFTHFSPTSLTMNLAGDAFLELVEHLPKTLDSLKYQNYPKADNSDDCWKSRLAKGDDKNQLDHEAEFIEGLSLLPNITMLRLHLNCEASKDFYGHSVIMRMKAIRIEWWKRISHDTAPVDDEFLLATKWERASLIEGLARVTLDGISRLILQWATGQRRLRYLNIFLHKFSIEELKSKLSPAVAFKDVHFDKWEIFTGDGRSLFVQHKLWFQRFFNGGISLLTIMDDNDSYV